jgi:hypothetical protein
VASEIGAAPAWWSRPDGCSDLAGSTSRGEPGKVELPNGVHSGKGEPMKPGIAAFIVIVLCIVAAGFRFGMATYVDKGEVPDGDALAIEVAGHLAAGRGYVARPIIQRSRDPRFIPGHASGFDEAQTEPTAAVMPAYPVLLSLALKAGLPARTAVVAVNMLLGALGVLAVWALTRALFGDGMAVLAGLLMALDPLQGFLAGYAEPRLMAGVFGALALCFLAVAEDDLKVVPVILSGLAMGVALLSGPVGLLFVIPALVVLLGAHSGAGRKVICAEIWIVLVVAFIGAWTVRNARAFDGRIMPLTAIHWESFARGNNRGAEGVVLDAKRDLTLLDWEGPIGPKGEYVRHMPRVDNEWDIDDLYRHVGLEYVKKSPSFAGTLFFHKLRRLWRVKPGFGDTLFGIGSMVYFVVLYAAAFLGMVALGRKRTWLNALLLVLVFFTIAHSAQYAQASYRVEIAGVLSVLAAGVFSGVKRIAERIEASEELRRARRQARAASK